MIKSVEELTTKLDKIIDRLPKYKSEVASEQVIYNNELQSIVEQLEDYENKVREIMEEKIAKDIPKCDEAFFSPLEKKKYKFDSIFNLFISANIFRKMRVDELLYKISVSNDVDEVNNLIIDYIDIFKKYGIELNINDFDYTYYVTNYMVSFFKCCNSDKFNFFMKKAFDDIYWECPNIIKELELSLREIVNKYAKVLEKNTYHELYEQVKDLGLNINNYYKEYMEFLNMLEEVKNNDKYYLFTEMSENKDLIGYYNKKDVMLNKYMEQKTFEELSDDDQNMFFDNIFKYYNNLREYKFVFKYRYVFDYVNKILKENVTKVDVQNKKKEIKKEEATLKKNNQLIIKVSKKIETLGEENEKTHELLAKKQELSNIIVDSVNRLYELSKEERNIQFKYNAINSFRNTEVLYDAILLMNNNYEELIKVISQNAEENIVLKANKFIESLKFNHVDIFKNTSFKDIDSINELITKKYSLSNIKTSIPDVDTNAFSELLNELFGIYLYRNVLKNEMNISDIEVIVENNKESFI